MQILSLNLFAEFHQILATATGFDTHVFSLDGGEFQLGGLFGNVSAGLHTITIIDSNSCFKEQIELVIIDHPKFLLQMAMVLMIVRL